MCWQMLTKKDYLQTKTTDYLVQKRTFSSCVLVANPSKVNDNPFHKKNVSVVGTYFS